MCGTHPAIQLHTVTTTLEDSLLHQAYEVLQDSFIGNPIVHLYRKRVHWHVRAHVQPRRHKTSELEHRPVKRRKSRTLCGKFQS